MLRRSSSSERLALLAALAYFAAVALIGALGVAPAELASSPQAIAHGRVWTLLSSGLLVAGSPAATPLLAAAAAALLLARRAGARTFWSAALAGHLGSALVAYAGVGLLLASGITPAGAHWLGAADYGISCVWFATLGGLLALLCRSARERTWTLHGDLPLTLAWPLALVGVTAMASDQLTSAEHVLAFLLGAWVLARRGPAPARLTRRRRPRAARPRTAPAGA